MDHASLISRAEANQGYQKESQGREEQRTSDRMTEPLESTISIPNSPSSQQADCIYKLPTRFGQEVKLISGTCLQANTYIAYRKVRERDV